MSLVLKSGCALAPRAEISKGSLNGKVIALKPLRSSIDRQAGMCCKTVGIVEDNCSYVTEILLKGGR